MTYPPPPSVYVLTCWRRDVYFNIYIPRFCLHGGLLVKGWIFYDMSPTPYRLCNGFFGRCIFDDVSPTFFRLCVVQDLVRNMKQLRHLALNELLLDVEEVPGLLAAAAKHCTETLHSLELLNCSKVSCAVISVVLTLHRDPAVP